MRSLLAALYVELITHCSDLSPEKAWNEAKLLYKHIQKTIAVPFVEDLLATSDAASEMKRTALRGLENEKKMLHERMGSNDIGIPLDFVAILREFGILG